MGYTPGTMCLMPKRKQGRKRRRTEHPRRPPIPTSQQLMAEHADIFIRKLDGSERRVDLPGYASDGAACPEVLLRGPEVKEYADLIAMRHDFEHVLAMCDHAAVLTSDLRLDDLNLTIGIRATWEAAIVAYGRAFVSGVSAAPEGGGRTRFPATVLDRLTRDQRAVHERTLLLRNKHVGHRVNDWTQVKVTAVLNPEARGPRSVLRLGTKLLTVLGGGEHVAQLREVVVILRDGLTERIEALQAEIEAGIRQQPIDELYSAAYAETEASKTGH